MVNLILEFHSIPFRLSRRQWDGLIKHWKIRIHEWDQSRSAIEGETSAPDTLSNTTTKRSNDGTKKSDANAELEIKDYNSHWLSAQENRILDWSEECDLEDQLINQTKEEEQDNNLETKRRRTLN